MLSVKELLDTARDSCIPPNDTGLANALKVVPSSVSNWRNGRSYPDVVTCEKLAKMTGFPVLSVIASVNEQRAIRADEKAVWRRLATAAVLLLAVGLNTLPAHASDTLNEVRYIHYAKFRLLARFLSAKLRSFRRTSSLIRRKEHRHVASRPSTVLA